MCSNTTAHEVPRENYHLVLGIFVRYSVPSIHQEVDR